MRRDSDSQVSAIRMILNRLDELNSKAIVYADLNDALVGIAYIPGEAPCAVYDRTLAKRILTKTHRLTEEAADRHIDEEAGSIYPVGTQPIFVELWR